MSDARYSAALSALLDRSKRIPRDVDERFVRLTRCQWSARKRRRVSPYTTLYRWVAQMRDTAPEAWAYATSCGLRIDGRSVRFRGRPVAGSRLVKPVSEWLEHPSVQAFEREAAVSALRRFEGLRLSPGRWGRHLVGCGLKDGQVRFGRLRVQLDLPEEVATVGHAFEASEDFAMASAQALEHPDLFVAAAWRTSVSARGARPEAKKLLGTIAARVRAAIASQSLPSKETAYVADELVSVGLAGALEELQGLIWPSPRPLDVERLSHELRRLTALRRSPLRPRTAWTLADP